MDDSFQDLEAELKALRPRRPSELLGRRIESELGAAAPAERSRYSTATSLSSWKWASWRGAALAAAAAVAVVVVWRAVAPRAEMPAAPRVETDLASTVPDRMPAAVPAPAANFPDVYRPISAASVLYDLKDEGEVLLAGEMPARQARYRYVDTYTWQNADRNASLKWSVPRDEVRVVPARLY